MRQIVNFTCGGESCVGTLDDAAGDVGLLIVSGGNEIRIGSHGSMAHLAADVAESGYPVFRYDRRGVGDSGGTNGAFESSGPDIEAALTYFLRAQPQMRSVIAMGNCDGATALVLYRPEGIARLLLTNPWVVAAAHSEPPPEVARAHYVRQLRNPRAWFRLLRGDVNLQKVASGLSLAVNASDETPLARAMATALATRPIPTTILLAEHDSTAVTFAHQWTFDIFDSVRRTVNVQRINSNSHSFASSDDYAEMLGCVLKDLARATDELKP